MLLLQGHFILIGITQVPTILNKGDTTDNRLQQLPRHYIIEKSHEDVRGNN